MLRVDSCCCRKFQNQVKESKKTPKVFLQNDAPLHSLVNQINPFHNQQHPNEPSRPNLFQMSTKLLKCPKQPNYNHQPKRPNYNHQPKRLNPNNQPKRLNSNNQTKRPTLNSCPKSINSYRILAI